MAKYFLKLADRKEVAESTMAFYFDKPQGFEFKAGQYADIKLINPPENDAEGPIRTFSIASAPQENFLMFAIRMRDSAFKRVLGSMPDGSEIEIDGPFGSFILHQNSARPAIFLAGGIGITPFRSIILDASRRGLSHKIFLFYSNRRPEDAAFLEELAGVENSNYKFIPTVTAPEKSGMEWKGETGFITLALLQKYLPDTANAVFYIVGPPPMTAAMYQMLTLSGISSDDIKSEEFSGY